MFAWENECSNSLHAPIVYFCFVRTPAFRTQNPECLAAAAQFCCLCPWVMRRNVPVALIRPRAQAPPPQLDHKAPPTIGLALIRPRAQAPPPQLDHTSLHHSRRTLLFPLRKASKLPVAGTGTNSKLPGTNSKLPGTRYQFEATRYKLRYRYQFEATRYKLRYRYRRTEVKLWEAGPLVILGTDNMM